jgi:hypothetical protein
MAIFFIALAAAARLLLQISQMPPYAGLDEIYHVARIEFVAAEGRNPTDREPSIPPYIHDSIHLTPGAVPAFAVIRNLWAPAVAEGMRLPADRPLLPAELAPYRMPNYEAQQPSLYYSLAALIRPSQASALAGLRVWRLLSVCFALIAVVAVSLVGHRLFGSFGLIAGAVLVATPTWLTLTVRAGNDALACAALAVAVAATIAAPQRWSGIVIEALAWAVAFAAKLYTWPAAFILPILWWNQKAGKRRVGAVLVAGTIAVVLTVLDLRQRTSSALGLFAFDAPAGKTITPHLDLLEMAKITFATFAWTSGQHGNALRPILTVVYLLPLLLILLAGMLSTVRSREHRPLVLATATAVLMFFAGQVLNVVAYLRHAPELGSGLPSGGKEGWYYWTLAPLLVGFLAIAGMKRARPILAAVFLAWWFAWDITIHEGGLFRDWRGWTAPDRAGIIFRWGSVPEADRDVSLAVGPFAGLAQALRALHVFGTLGAAAAIITSRREEDV